MIDESESIFADNDDDLPLFIDDDDTEDNGSAQPRNQWKVLIVDDDEEVHQVTTLVLKDFVFDKQHLAFYHAYSATEAKQLLTEHHDFAVCLLDVVMETDSAGLDLVPQIRNELGNPFIRIVLRTGQPGHAPEEEVIAKHDINDYKDKTELTGTKLRTVMYAALRAYRDLMILEYMPSIVITTDSEGIVNHWNAAAEKLSGVPIREALHKFLGDVLPQLNKHANLVKVANHSRQPQRATRILFDNDGDKKLYDLLIYPLHRNAGGGAVVRLDDVTNEVQLQEMVLQNEKMKSLGGLAAGMAHELNNPLGAILQGIQNIIRRTTPTLAKNEEVAQEVGLDLHTMQAYIDRRQITQFLNSIREAGDRASHIVSNMLNFSRGKVTHHVPTNLNELLDNTIELVGHDYDLKRHYDFSRIKLAREYGDNLPLVPCSPVEIQQVMINLLKNATQALLDHTPPISTPMITIRTQFRDDMVLVEIEDNGPGMDEATRKRVFEPFFTTKEVGRGTGLGLSVSYFIVTTHHSGLMNVVSHRGEGCCFSIGLPLKP